MKKFIKLSILPLAALFIFSCVSDDSASRFQSNPESGWIEFANSETTVAVTSRTTDVTIPIVFTAPINRNTVTVNYAISNVQGNANSVTSGLSTSATIIPNTNRTAITFDILPDAVSTLIADGDVIFDIEITSANGAPVGLSDGSAVVVHRVNLLCGGEPPVGTYVIDMHDSYGDGWQTDDPNGGSGITVVTTNVDGEESIIEFGMCSPYTSAAGTFLGGTECTGPASTSFFDATTTIEIAPDVVGAVWNFPGDNWGEISFEIYKPDGTLLYAAGIDEPAGELPVSYCD